MQIYTNEVAVARGEIWWWDFELWITSFLFGKPIKKK
jgi:hypothetical protein